jgi:monoamine oxidase
VPEADDRVDGRTKARHIAGDVVDLGGQWVGPTQTHVLALASELGVATYPQYVAGRAIIDIAGHHATYEGETPSLAPDAMDEFPEVLGKIETLAARTPIPHAWDAPEAAEWDGQTVESWLVANARHPVS